MGNLPIILFLLGVVFLLMGWRWQSPPNEEAMTALKGLAYLKREILRVQDQVHILEDKIQTLQRNESEEAVHREVELRDVAHREVEHREIKHREIKHLEIECNKKSQIYALKPKEQSERTSGVGGDLKRNISPKYQEVLELAAKGHRIPEIAQLLMLSQDAVMMVLQTQTKGAAQ